MTNWQIHLLLNIHLTWTWPSPIWFSLSNAFLQYSCLWAYSISAHGPCASCGYFSCHNQKNPLKLKFALTILVILVLFKPKPRAHNKANPASHAEPRIHKMNSTFQLGASYWSLQLSKFTVIITYVENSTKNCKTNVPSPKVNAIPGFFMTTEVNWFQLNKSYVLQSLVTVDHLKGIWKPSLQWLLSLVTPPSFNWHLMHRESGQAADTWFTKASPEASAVQLFKPNRKSILRQPPAYTSCHPVPAKQQLIESRMVYKSILQKTGKEGHVFFKGALQYIQ